MSIRGAVKTGTIRPSAGVPVSNPTVYRVLFAISLVHLFNDSIQSVIPAIYPILKESMQLNYSQIGWISFYFNLTASIMQPVIGIYTDRKPKPYMLPLGMAATFLGMLLLAYAPSYGFVLLAVSLVGLGSAAFHPQGSKVAHLAAGSRKGLAQSIFQVGGNAGQSLAPLLTKWIFIPLGQFGAIWFTLVAGAAMLVQTYIAFWYRGLLSAGATTAKKTVQRTMDPTKRKQIISAIIVLVFLVFVRSWYSAAMTSYYAFYLRDVVGTTLEQAQIYIFLFLAAGALGTFFGGPLADRFGQKTIILGSMLGGAPLAVLIPYVSLEWAAILLPLIGFIAFSSFSVTVVYAQTLIPGKVGMVSGLITGFAFGMGGLGALVLGSLIDIYGISLIMKLSGYLLILGILTLLLPSDRKLKEWSSEN
ncbi:MFS transporter [Paenibacillus lutrae]|uniref:MFS transporter n=1 Tax=Paenibacillus lutrae TaxID=2078573 RepID=A0A7X3FE18_9BACL|nr:MFS transporter [Paenibacillus lutrae]MVO97990.1 MFS transporter [Paenibacillus lutrae]